MATLFHCMKINEVQWLSHNFIDNVMDQGYCCSVV